MLTLLGGMWVLWQTVRGRLTPWLAGIVMLLLTQACSMAIPQLFRRAIDGIQAQAGEPALRRVALYLVLCAGVGMLCRLASRVLILFAARDAEMRLRGDYFAHLTALDPGFFARHPSGDLMSRSTNDLLQVRLMLGPGLLNIVNTLVAYVTAVPLMIGLSGKLTLFTFIIYPFGLWGMRRLGRQMFSQNRAQQSALGDLSNIIQENVAGAQLVRAYAIELPQRARFLAGNQAYFQAGRRLAITRSLMSRYSMSLTSIATLIAVMIGVRDVLAGHMTLGTVVAMVEYMALLAYPTFALGWVWSLWQRGRASMERIAAIMAQGPLIVSGPQHPDHLAASLEVRGLSIRYGDHAALDNISLTVPAGTTLGVVGAIGSGKSTLVRAWMRLEPVPAQTVFVGGEDVVALSLPGVRRMFGYVPQNPSLMSKSVADNIAFGMPKAPRAEVEAAAQGAALGADLGSLPDGLDTHVGERGVTLSGGQKQRAAIARASLLDPPILVLDDALSAVDVTTEAAILQHLRGQRRGRTTVIVSHRLSAVEHADDILVLAGGRVVERGTAAALRQVGGPFAAMASMQASAEEVAP